MIRAQAGVLLFVITGVAERLLQPLIRIGEEAIKCILQILNCFVFSESISCNVEFNAACDEQVIFFIDGVGELFGQQLRDLG